MRALLNRASDAWYALAVRALRPYERRWARKTRARNARNRRPADVVLTLYPCTDADCIRAGHTAHASSAVTTRRPA